MREADFERFVVNKIRSVGGRAYKWVCPGLTGAPDRICVFPGGKIIFAELKRPGVKDGLSARQKKVASLLENLGCTVRRVGSKEDFRKLMEEAGYDI